MAGITVTKGNFQDLVMNSEKTVLLDFWATWCGPCRMLAPIVEEVAQSREDLVLGKVNVDEEPELAIRYGIASIPTLLVFKHGKLTAKSVGYCSQAAVEALLDQ